MNQFLTRLPRKTQAGLLGVITTLLLTGCTTTSAPTSPTVVHRDPVLSEWASWTAPTPMSIPDEATTSSEPAAPEVLPSAPPAPAVVRPALPPRTLPTLVISDLDLPDVAEISTVLRVLAKAADVNILVSPNAQGPISFTFRDVAWDQAFRSILASAALTYTWEGDVLRVLTMEDMRNELAMETLLKEREQVRADLRRVEPMTIQVIPIRYSRAKPLGATVAQLLAASALDDGATDLTTRSHVSVDEENNAIIVHAVRDDIDKVLGLIHELDRPRVQVHIEARIVEATRDAARQLGVQWGGQAVRTDGTRVLTAGGPGATIGGYNADFPAQFAQGGDSPVGLTFGLISEKIGGSELLSMQLSALQQRGRIHILSSPSITTLDNEPAIIESGEERAYRKTTGTGNILDVSLEWKKAVLKLEVTPSVVDEDYLRVEIIANKDSFDETKPQTNNEFPVNTKFASTTVLLRNGETVVIGGLSLESDSTTESGIPYLMDIPGLGLLFKNRGTSQRFDETLIFITPTILQAHR